MARLTEAPPADADRSAGAVRAQMTDERLLVPLDGSAESNAALPLARTLADVMGLPIRLLRVVPLEDLQTGHQARMNLYRIAEELASSGLSVESIVREGPPGEEILAEIQTTPIGLVVMRTHGRAGLSRAILGSVTERVLRDAHLPMVLLRPGGHRVTKLAKLLVPVDGTPGGAVALGAAVGLARQSGASIKLIQITVPLAMQQPMVGGFGSMAYIDPAWDEQALASAKGYVAGLQANLQAQGLDATGQAMRALDVAEAIVEVATTDATDMVVMSTHALTGPARAVLGSVADAVVRSAPCPVLLVRRAQCPGPA